MFGKLVYRLLLFSIFIFPHSGKAQTLLCRGALGDPIIKIDFGRGVPEHGPAISETSLFFQASGTPQDGWYTIAKRTNGMLPSNWHQIGNHTPNDPDGYMMIVNASDEPSVFYEAPILGLCPNTTYQFSAWIINLLTYNEKKPNLTFSIETGQDIFTHDTGDILEGSATNWIEHGFLFTTPANVSNITIKIRNNGEGGNGNDICIDDITFKPCGPVIIPSINGSQTSANSLCMGDTKDFLLSAEATPGVYVNPQYLWQQLNGNGLWEDMPQETSPQYKKQFTNAVVGNYKYRLLVAEYGNINSPNCRTSSPVFELNVSPLPALRVADQVTVCVGDPINLSVNSASTYKWNGPLNFSSAIQSPTITNATTDMAGTYTVIVANEAGCEAGTQTEVTVIPRPIAVIAPISPICKGSSVTLNASGGNSYRWEPTTGLSDAHSANPIASPDRTTDYTVYVSNGACETQALVTVQVIKELKALAGNDQKIIKGNSVQLKGSVTGENIDRIFWTPSDDLDDPTKLNPVAKPTVSTTYTLNVISASGCASSTDKVFVKVYDKLVIPNSFSPNGDGINDLWNVIALDTYANPTVKVVNRYGQLMFEGKNNHTTWNGKRGNEDVPVGVYYYMIYLEDGLNPLTGSLMVIR